MNPSCLCLCGCGESAPISRGKPKNYKHGHNARTDEGRARSRTHIPAAIKKAQEKRLRQRKLGPYKAGATRKAQAVLSKIEAALTRKERA
jgi:hypothetical protein